jgi:hypothetical protein
VGSILDLLKHLPEAAQSPLAFVAYCLVVAAWLVQRWLALKPQREAKGNGDIAASWAGVLTNKDESDAIMELTSD